MFGRPNDHAKIIVRKHILGHSEVLVIQHHAMSLVPIANYGQMRGESILDPPFPANRKICRLCDFGCDRICLTSGTHFSRGQPNGSMQYIGKSAMQQP